MGRGEFAEYLRGRGFAATVEKDEVVVKHSDKRVFSVVGDLAVMVGYKGRWSWKKEDEK